MGYWMENMINLHFLRSFVLKYISDLHKELLLFTYLVSFQVIDQWAFKAIIVEFQYQSTH